MGFISGGIVPILYVFLDYSLGQSWVLHRDVISFFPLQSRSFPVEQVRDLACCPAPHVLEQVPHALQGRQPSHSDKFKVL